MRRAALLAVAMLAVGASAWGLGPRMGLDVALARLVLGRAEPPSPTVVLVVLDTVRADRASLCGYGKPTTPTLAGMVADGAAFTCGARTPGSWTLPSHASYFTGLPVIEHGTHELVSGGVRPDDTSEHVRPLGKDVPTLAEEMAARGYQTLSVSGNPVVGAPAGLVRGFHDAVAAEEFGELRGDGLLDEVERAVRLRAAPDRPLFLFVNVADAHPPFQSVPAGLDAAPATERVLYYPNRPRGLWRRFYAGTLSEAERGDLLARISPLYDYGVWRADRTLGGLVARMDASGWCDRGCRYVVVSDHGEFLGEKGLIDHGHYVWEPDTRVPLLVWEKGTGAAPPALPPVVNALHAFHLARDGALPAEPAPVMSVAWPHERRCHNTRRYFCDTTVALWEDDQKYLWRNGQSMRFDLARDPGEDRPIAVNAAMRARLEALGARVTAAGQSAEAMDPNLLEALLAAGYLE